MFNDGVICLCAFISILYLSAIRETRARRSRRGGVMNIATAVAGVGVLASRFPRRRASKRMTLMFVSVLTRGDDGAVR